MSLFYKFRAYYKDDLAAAAAKMEAVLAFHVDEVKKMQAIDTPTSKYEERIANFERFKSDLEKLKAELNKQLPKKNISEETLKVIGTPKKMLQQEQPSAIFEDEDNKYEKLSAAYDEMVSEMAKKEVQIEKLENQLANKEAVNKENARMISRLKDSIYNLEQAERTALDYREPDPTADRVIDTGKSIDKNTPVFSGKEVVEDWIYVVENNFKKASIGDGRKLEEIASYVKGTALQFHKTVSAERGNWSSFKKLLLDTFKAPDQAQQVRSDLRSLKHDA